jgi:hypothetical protein
VKSSRVHHACIIPVVALIRGDALSCRVERRVVEDAEMARTRRFHLDFPTVITTVADRRVSFVGATFHSRCVMIEYDVEPPMDRSGHPFGPRLLTLVVTDDADPSPYPTRWEDFDWSFEKSGRMTTRLDRRPGPEATRLEVSVRSVHAAATADGGTQYLPSDDEVATFVVVLPADHASTPPDRLQG